MNTELFEISVLTIINSGSIFLLIVLLANSVKDKLSLWLSIMTIIIIGWVNTAYLGYIDANSTSALIFYRLNGAFVAMFFYVEYMLYVESFLKLKNTLIKSLILLTSILFSLLILFTNLVISGITWQSWGNEIIFGPANDLFGLFAILINISLIVLLITKYFKLSQLEKNKVLFFLVGTFIFIFSNIAFNVIIPEAINSARYQHFGDYSSVLFLILTAFAIVRRKFMNVKIALTALLIGIIGMLLIIDILALSHNPLEQGLKTIILIFFAVISVFLVRSVINEIRQKEALAQTNKALDVSRQKYIDLASEQKDIIDVMGHEIRTPLTAIVQEIKLHKNHTLPIKTKLLEEAKGKADLEKVLPYLFESIGTIDKASIHAVSLVTDMLETARLDKNRFELNYEKFDLIEVMKSSVDLMKKTIDKDPSIKYNINCKEGQIKNLEVEADKTRIGQAVYALLNNAIKYRDPEKSNVNIDVSIGKNNDKVIIKIADNGIGIANEDIHKLGKKFLRLDPKTGGNLKRPGGTGLGLYVVKGIMDHHKGRMLVESEGMHKGSTFILELPIYKASSK